jgi:hypothetical protein
VHVLLTFLRKVPVWGWVILTLLALIGLQNLQLAQVTRQRDAERWRVDALEAARDTTRMRLVRTRDSMVRVFQRRIIQEKQRADAFDMALQLERRARIVATLRLDSLLAQVAGTPTIADSDGVRTSQFHLRQPPYTVEATAVLPPPPEQGRLVVAVRLDPLPLHLRVGCGPAVRGVRPATASLVVPPWATVSLDSLSQSPEVCVSPIALEPPKKRWPWVVGGLVAGVIGWELIR